MCAKLDQKSEIGHVRAVGDGRPGGRRRSASVAGGRRRPLSDPLSPASGPPESPQDRPQSLPVLRFSDPRVTCASVFRLEKHPVFRFSQAFVEPPLLHTFIGIGPMKTLRIYLHPFLSLHLRKPSNRQPWQDHETNLRRLPNKLQADPSRSMEQANHH